jgi:hypothetical protein
MTLRESASMTDVDHFNCNEGNNAHTHRQLLWRGHVGVKIKGCPVSISSIRLCLALGKDGVEMNDEQHPYLLIVRWHPRVTNIKFHE